MVIIVAKDTVTLCQLVFQNVRKCMLTYLTGTLLYCGVAR